MIKTWIFEFFPEPLVSQSNPNNDLSRYFSSYQELWARDEARGFNGIFFSEHHFGGSLGPSPNLLIAAIASRTRNLRLGVMGVVTSLYAPWRIVEEIEMLDQLTGGRLEIGTAVGIPQELARVNMSMAEARERNDEAVQFLDAALASDTVTFRGKYFSCENLRLLPRPVQSPSPPKWTTVVSVDFARKAARRRSKISTAFNQRHGSRRFSTHIAMRRTAAAFAPVQTTWACDVALSLPARKVKRVKCPPRSIVVCARC